MRIALLGAKGMLASAIESNLIQAGIHCFSFSRKDIDISDPSELEKLLNVFPLDAVINCAGYTNVDECEKNSAKAMLLNGRAVGKIASFCKTHNLPIIHFSTDYVFDGSKKTAYVESDPPNPINVYGKSKLLGEELILASGAQFYIFRVQWLYGNNGKNFVTTLLNLSKTQNQFSIVNNQWGSPTWTRDVAEGVTETLTKRLPFGIYHFANHGHTTWYQFADFFFRLSHRNVRLNPSSAVSNKRPAKRPLNSKLSTEKIDRALRHSQRSWQQAISAFILSLPNL